MIMHMFDKVDTRKNKDRDKGIISKEEKTFEVVVNELVSDLPDSLKIVLVNSQKFIDDYRNDIFEEMIDMQESKREAYFCEKVLKNIPREEIYSKNLSEEQFGWIKDYCDEIDQRLEMFCDFIGRNCGLTEVIAEKWIEKIKEKNNFVFIYNKNEYLKMKAEYKNMLEQLEKDFSLSQNRVFVKKLKDSEDKYKKSFNKYAKSVAIELVVCKFQQMALKKIDYRTEKDYEMNEMFEKIFSSPKKR